MSMEQAMPLREVKNRLSEVVDRVAGQHDRVVITRHGRPAAVVLSPDDLASLEETLDVMGCPRLLADIRRAWLPRARSCRRRKSWRLSVDDHPARDRMASGG